MFRGEDCTKPEQLAGAPFGLPQRAMNVCAKEGITKIQVGAAIPAAR